MTEHRTFLALPSYAGRLTTRAAQTIYRESTIYPTIQCATSSSLLCQTFNALWCEALNLRHQGITHFAMLHDDIEPEGFWIDTMIEEMERVGADIISAVVPFKNNSGLTSTAVESSDPWRPRRLTLTEIDGLPVTFNSYEGVYESPSLLINTGCLVCRFTEEWVERVCFHIEDAIIKTDAGKFEPRAIPEDWNFSRWAHNEGLRIAATRKVRLTHIGQAPFPNYGVWGDKTDPLWRWPEQLAIEEATLEVSRRMEASQRAGIGPVAACGGGVEPKEGDEDPAGLSL